VSGLAFSVSWTTAAVAAQYDLEESVSSSARLGSISTMLDALKRHPFEIVARFEDVLVLTYALAPASLRALLPPGLTLDTFGESGRGVGFLAVALVKVSGMRPRFLPSWMGRRFVLVGYRVFARFRDARGITRRGLRILQSRTDRRIMVAMGNLLTHYRYRRADIAWHRSVDRLEVTLREPGGGELQLDVRAELDAEAPLPAGSPFRDWRQAQRFAGPLPWTFDYDRRRHAIVMIKGERLGWSPRPVTVDVRVNRFLAEPTLAAGTPVLASAFHLTGIDYRWLPGVLAPLPEAAGCA
jgi:hypothetical protein